MLFVQQNTVAPFAVDIEAVAGATGPTVLINGVLSSLTLLEFDVDSSVDAPVMRLKDQHNKTVVAIYRDGTIAVTPHDNSIGNATISGYAPADQTAPVLDLGLIGTGAFLQVDAVGRVIAPHLPTSDPGISGALYSIAGVVHVSP